MASAFIKSIRGSDPDAALHYLARMLAAGEDPRFVARRLVISASEDIGLADPQALPIAVAAFQALEFVGLPEARLNLAEAVVYLALAPKSNSAYAALGAAARELEEARPGRVPSHLQSASYAGERKLGIGVGYVYPHDHPGHWAAQRYLPEGLRGGYYQPTDQGREAAMAEAWRRRRGQPSRTARRRTDERRGDRGRRVGHGQAHVAGPGDPPHDRVLRPRAPRRLPPGRPPRRLDGLLRLPLGGHGPGPGRGGDGHLLQLPPPHGPPGHPRRLGVRAPRAGARGPVRGRRRRPPPPARRLGRGPEVAEAAALARQAMEGQDPSGRPLFAAHAALPWPEAPHLALWHAATLYREFRGDGHVACLTVDGIDGCEAHVLAAGAGQLPGSVLREYRGWSDEEWAAAVERLGTGAGSRTTGR